MLKQWWASLWRKRLLLQNNNPFQTHLILDLWVCYSRMLAQLFKIEFKPPPMVQFYIFGKCKTTTTTTTTVKADSRPPQFLENLKYGCESVVIIFIDSGSGISFIVKHFNFFLKTWNGVESTRRKDLWTRKFSFPLTTHRQPTQIDHTSFVTCRTAACISK